MPISHSDQVKNQNSINNASTGTHYSRLRSSLYCLLLLSLYAGTAASLYWSIKMMNDDSDQNDKAIDALRNDASCSDLYSFFSKYGGKKDEDYFCQDREIFINNHKPPFSQHCIDLADDICTVNGSTIAAAFTLIIFCPAAVIASVCFTCALFISLKEKCWDSRSAEYTPIIDSQDESAQTYGAFSV